MSAEDHPRFEGQLVGPRDLLVLALRKAAADADKARDAVRDMDDDHPDDRLDEASGALFEAAELVRVLARLVEGKNLHDAFGAPGDWGYQTAIGAALYRFYSTPNTRTGPAIRERDDEIELLRDALKLKTAGEEYAHRLAVMLECALLDRRGTWDDGHALLAEYREACRMADEPPTFMGEPLL